MHPNHVPEPYHVYVYTRYHVYVYRTMCIVASLSLSLSAALIGVLLFFECSKRIGIQKIMWQVWPLIWPEALCAPTMHTHCLLDDTSSILYVGPGTYSIQCVCGTRLRLDDNTRSFPSWGPGNLAQKIDYEICAVAA